MKRIQLNIELVDERRKLELRQEFDQHFDYTNWRTDQLNKEFGGQPQETATDTGIRSQDYINKFKELWTTEISSWNAIKWNENQQKMN